MLVRVTDLPPNGLIINDTIPLAPLNARMATGDHTDIKFTEAPRVELSIIPTQAGGAQMSGKVRSKYLQPCGRCLDPLEREIEVEANYVLAQRPPPERGAKPAEPVEEDCVDDVGLVYFDGDQIELEDLIQESLILGLSVFWSPPCDNKGNCKLCGFNIDKINAVEQNKEEKKTVRFADLLEKAKKIKKGKKSGKRAKKRLH